MSSIEDGYAAPYGREWIERKNREHKTSHGAGSELACSEWVEELEAAIRKLYDVIPRMAELGEDAAWLEDAVHARNQLEMIAKEKRSRSSTAEICSEGGT